MLYIGAFRSPVAAALPTAADGCSCRAESDAASSPFPNAQGPAAPALHTLLRSTCAHPIRLLKISQSLPNANLSIPTTAAVGERMLKDKSRLGITHRTTSEMCPGNENAGHSCFTELYVTEHRLMLWLPTESPLAWLFDLITLSHLGAKVHLSQFCSSNYTLKTKHKKHQKTRGRAQEDLTKFTTS